MNKTLIHKYFTDDELLSITDTIKQNEKLTSGEICLAIKPGKPFLKRKIDVVEFAKAEFEKIGMHNTKDKTGILIYILLKDRQFHILADSGINDKVEQKVWDDISDKMIDQFKIGNYTKGIISTINNVGNVLKEHFPIQAGDINELPDDIDF